MNPELFTQLFMQNNPAAIEGLAGMLAQTGTPSAALTQMAQTPMGVVGVPAGANPMPVPGAPVMPAATMQSPLPFPSQTSPNNVGQLISNPYGDMLSPQGTAPLPMESPQKGLGLTAEQMLQLLQSGQGQRQAAPPAISPAGGRGVGQINSYAVPRASEWNRILGGR